MYVTNQKPKYYIWDFREGKNFKTFNNKMDFLTFIAKQFREYSTIVLNEVDLDFKKEISNWVLKCCICSEGDLNTACRNASYQLFDEYDRILSPADVWDEAIKIWEKYYRDPIVNLERERRAWQKKYRNSRPDNFRRGPVPRTGKHNFHWRIGFRAPKTTAQKRFCCAPEQKYFNRGSWKHLPSLYDDIIRVEERNWKSQSKRRHQWKPKKDG